jgi:putative copper export protein
VPAAFWVASWIRGLALAALAALLGGLAVETAVLVGDAAEIVAARRRLKAWRLLSGAGLLMATIGELAVRVQTMTGGPLATVVPAVPLVLTRTHFGAIWIARVLMLMAAIGLSVQPSRRWQLLALPATAGVALTISLAGHAAAWGDLSISVAADWLHVVASGVWVGGLFALAWVVFHQRAMRTSPHLASIISRFSRLAGWCVLLVVVTGVYNGWVQVQSIAALWTTSYGRVLLAKVLLVVVLVWFGAVNRYWFLPRLEGHAAPGVGRRLGQLIRSTLRPPRWVGGGAAAGLIGYIRREAALALVVLACAAILGESTPARHARHERHAGAHTSFTYRDEQFKALLGIPPEVETAAVLLGYPQIGFW